MSNKLTAGLTYFIVMLISGTLTYLLWNMAVVPLGAKPIKDVPQGICLVLLSNLLFGRPAWSAESLIKDKD